MMIADDDRRFFELLIVRVNDDLAYMNNYIDHRFGKVMPQFMVNSFAKRQGSRHQFKNDESQNDHEDTAEGEVYIGKHRLKNTQQCKRHSFFIGAIGDKKSEQQG